MLVSESTKSIPIPTAIYIWNSQLLFTAAINSCYSNLLLTAGIQSCYSQLLFKASTHSCYSKLLLTATTNSCYSQLLFTADLIDFFSQRDNLEQGGIHGKYYFCHIIQIWAPKFSHQKGTKLDKMKFCVKDTSIHFLGVDWPKTSIGWGFRYSYPSCITMSWKIWACLILLKWN